MSGFPLLIVFWIWYISNLLSQIVDLISAISYSRNKRILISCHQSFLRFTRKIKKKEHFCMLSLCEVKKCCILKNINGLSAIYFILCLVIIYSGIFSVNLPVVVTYYRIRIGDSVRVDSKLENIVKPEIWVCRNYPLRMRQQCRYCSLLAIFLIERSKIEGGHAFYFND